MILYCSNIRPKRIHISENKLFLLSEDVYTNGLDRNAKKASITYQKGFSADKKLTHTPTPQEGLKTDKMDSNGSGTYIVPLKNGINSYNITDIAGQEIMHYFKRLFSGQATNVAVKINGKKEDYQLEMNHGEVNNFLRQFITKVNFVVYDYVSKHKELTNRKIYGASQICIYPVKSSSNFNTKMTDMIVSNNQSIFGLPVIKLNEGLLKKDTSNIQKDEKFVSQNADYYNSRRGKFNIIDKKKGLLPGQATQTHLNGLNSDLNMYAAKKKVDQEIERLNSEVERMTQDLNQYREAYNKGDKKTAKKLAMDIISIFPDYCVKSQEKEIMEFAKYTDDMGNVITKNNQDRHASAEEKAKGNHYRYFREKRGINKKEVEKNTRDIIELLKIYNPFEYRILSKNTNGKGTSLLDKTRVTYRETIDFQIKKIFNDSRMGLKNFFSFDPKELEMAKKQIEGNILVIFDDNVSGGATLSDICSQFLSIGVKHIIPITFGKMFQQWKSRFGANSWANITAPENGFVFADKKTFVFNGETFNTDQITNPMDAANLYQETFGTYDKQGATELWNTYKNVMASNGKSVPQQSNSVLQQQQKLIDGEGTKGRGRRPYSEEERQRIINTTTATLNELIKQKNVVKQQMKSASSRQELNYLASEKKKLDKQIMIARSKIYNLQIHRTMTDGAKMRAAQKRMQSV